MKSHKNIFRQLWKTILIPFSLMLLVACVVSVLFSISNRQKYQEKMQSNINSELRSFVELQYFSLSVIEAPLNEKIRMICETLRDGALSNTSDIENVDLYKVMAEEGLDTATIDLYVINRNGVIVNSTEKNDLFLDFATFGDNHIAYLNKCFSNHEFGAPRFFFDSKVKRYRKYALMPTNDGKYMIEVGSFSHLADEVYSYSESFFQRKISEYYHVTDIAQFMLSTKPKTFDLSKSFPISHYPYLYRIENEREVSISDEDDSGTRYSYLYMDYSSDGINKGIIIGVKYDFSDSRQIANILFTQQTAWVFIIVIFSLVLVYFSVMKVDKSLNTFVNKVDDASKSANPSPIVAENSAVDNVDAFERLTSDFNKMHMMICERNNEIENKTNEINLAKRKIIELHELLSVQKQLVDEKRLGVEDDLGFAYSMQQSILPSADDLQRIFPESFIFFRPRNVVSGDFYWFRKIGNKAIVVVSDCSGHDIQASIITVQSLTMIRNIVELQKIVDPKSILSGLYEGQNNMCGDKAGQCSRYCNVDVSICCIDFENNMLSFASSNGSMSIVNNGLLQTYSGNMMLQGAGPDRREEVFDNKVIELAEGDIVYMFTNGYSSQFDADDTLKLNSAAFRKLLSQISRDPMGEQLARLNDNLANWQGGTEQTDDILVLGFKYSK